MFEFGKDLRKLFTQARESEDLSWLELIGVDLLASEARQQTTDAGRVSCTHPHPAWLRAAALWCEHARRTGRAESVRRALDAAADAAGAARTRDEIALADVCRAQALLVRFDLNGGPGGLDEALRAAPASAAGCRSQTAAQISAIHARLRARSARLNDDPAALMQAAALLDAAIHGLAGRPVGEIDELRMDRAALSLETGVIRRDANLLDQAGRELQALVTTASPDYRPLTRARALTLCAAGLSALAALADNAEAHAQGRLLFEAAADQFTPDHSPLDWVVIQIVRAATPGGASLAVLRQAAALSAGQGLVLGSVARDLLIEAEVACAYDEGDMDRLSMLESGVRRRLSEPMSKGSELDWAVDQIGMARIGAARAGLMGLDASLGTLGLAEAAEVAREYGVPAIAARAVGLLSASTIRV